jgi:uncharacterized protein with PQ loop repeat
VDLHTYAVATGYLGAALGVAMVVPQIARTLRDRTVPGVSALSWALTALACTSWLLYGVRAGELPQIPGNILLVSGSVVVALLVPSRVSVAGRAAGLLAPAVLISVLAALTPTPVIGAVAIGMALVSSVPQTVRSLRRRAASASAVSLLTWSLRVASQVCWLTYALVLHDATVAVSATFVLSNAVVVLGAEAARRPAPASAVALA